MRQFTVVIDDCAIVAAPGGPTNVRLRDTQHGNRNFVFNYPDLCRGLPRQLNDRELDWMHVIGSLYATDLACGRGEGDLDWFRSIDVHIPVRDPDYWGERKRAFEDIFTRFTSDSLSITFMPDPDAEGAPRMAEEPVADHDCVALVSGGVDSFVGAASLLSEGKRPIAVSHAATGIIGQSQSHVQSQLDVLHPGFQRLGFTARKHGQDFPDPEPSQRSRSLMFIGCAALVACVGGSRHVFINENGIMAIHLPLTSARIGSLSTHTASPVILDRIAELVSDIFGTPFTLENALVGRTKPAVAELGKDLGVGGALYGTVSCWSISRTRRHCGHCYPCLMRRISLEHAGLQDAPYVDDLFQDHEALEREAAADNLIHLVQQIDQIASSSSTNLQIAYPELIGGGAALSMNDTIALYRQWANEAAGVLYSYPVPQSVR